VEFPLLVFTLYCYEPVFWQKTPLPMAEAVDLAMKFLS